MCEYGALLTSAVMTEFTMAAGSRLNTENSFEYYYWNEFNQMWFTFLCDRGAAICHHYLSWSSCLGYLKMYFN